jgi:hypothetical protein
MRGLILILLVINTFVVFSQEKLQLVTGFSGSFEKEVLSNSASQLYGGIGLDAGVRFNRNKGSLDVLLNYQFSSNVTYRYPYDSISIDNQKTEHYDAAGNRIRFPYRSLLRSHFVGLSLKYNFKKERKIVNPFISIQVLTEVGSNFKDGFLIYGSFIPSQTKTGQQSSGFGDIFLASNFYNSTPLVGSALGGVNIEFCQNTSLNIAVGYAYRMMKVKYAEWKEDEDVYKKLQSIPTENVFSHFLDVQLGFTYVFSFKNKPKPQ